MLGQPDAAHTRNTSDPGDDTQRRFRYQAAYAAILSLDLIDSDGKFGELFCEHHEDVLISLRAGGLVGVAVKTRKPGKPPFKAGDAEIIQSILRFIEHEVEFPGEFDAYTIVSSTGFWEEQENSSNLTYLLRVCRQHPQHPAVARFIATLKRSERRRRALDATILWNPLLAGTVLSKLSVERGPGLDDVENRLVRLLGELPGAKGRALEDLVRAAELLIDTMWRAGSLSHLATLRDYIVLSSRAESDRAAISAKRISATQVTQTLTIALGPSYKRSSDTRALALAELSGEFHKFRYPC